MVVTQAWMGCPAHAQHVQDWGCLLMQVPKTPPAWHPASSSIFFFEHKHTRIRKQSAKQLFSLNNSIYRIESVWDFLSSFIIQIIRSIELNITFTIRV